MTGNGHSLRAIAGALALSWFAVGCAGSPLGDSVQQSLEADPQLEESSPFETAEAPESPQNPGEESTADADAAAGDDSENSVTARAPEPGDRDFIGPVPSRSLDSAPSTSVDDGAAVDDGATPNLAGISADLQDYIRDLQGLDGLELVKAAQNGEAATASPFGQSITRREYARWLFDAYNIIYADEPGERLRAGSPEDEPAFQDVSPANPDYEAIQGLAEAGIIPSAFTGNSTAVNFRPDAPLVREDLILWKVPLDTQSALPTTTPEAVKESWGFQDTASIDPLALRAIAADFQLGDFSNFRRAFGYTTLFRPDKAVSRAEAAAVLWRFGTQTEGRTAAEVEPASRPAND